MYVRPCGLTLPSIPCSLLRCLSHPAQSGLCRLVLPVAGPSLVQARAESQTGGPGLTTLTVRLSQRVMTGLAAPGPLLPGHKRRITHHSTLTGTRDRAACVKYFLLTDFFLGLFFAIFQQRFSCTSSQILLTKSKFSS